MVNFIGSALQSIHNTANGKSWITYAFITSMNKKLSMNLTTYGKNTKRSTAAESSNKAPHVPKGRAQCERNADLLAC